MDTRTLVFAGCLAGALVQVGCSDDEAAPTADVEVVDAAPDAVDRDAADVDVDAIDATLPPDAVDAEATTGDADDVPGPSDADGQPDDGAGPEDVSDVLDVPDLPDVTDAPDTEDVPPAPDVEDAGPDAPEDVAGEVETVEPGWVVLHREDFEDAPGLGSPEWTADPVPDDGPFSDAGTYFTEQGVTPPDAWRITEPFGDGDWLVAESYSRSSETAFGDLLSVVPDPEGGGNQVLRLASPAHTDATVIRPSEALPARYRISLRVGHASFGDGLAGDNGYDGGESAEPWGAPDATGENGFYWLAILDDIPRPHNNVWIHHHRKVVIDSDNNQAAWTRVWNGEDFVDSGHHPVMMFALDGLGASDVGIGKPFIPYAAGQWQPSGTIRAAEAYRGDAWYDVTIERFDDTFTLTVSGDFLYGGQATFSGSLDAAERCVWHYNRPGQDAATACVDESSLPELPGFPLWPASGGWPDWFMFGDPHNNYYEGEVYYDDVTLEVWQE
ncbi:MAG: hypothetical protein ACQEXJ_17940 [Myxococcota bacterium]